MLVQYPVLFLPAHADLQLLKQVKTSLSPDPAVKCIENDTWPHSYDPTEYRENL